MNVRKSTATPTMTRQMLISRRTYGIRELSQSHELKYLLRTPSSFLFHFYFSYHVSTYANLFFKETKYFHNQKIAENCALLLHNFTVKSKKK